MADSTEISPNSYETLRMQHTIVRDLGSVSMYFTASDPTIADTHTAAALLELEWAGLSAHSLE